MSVQITVSYTDDKKLQEIIQLLQPIIHHIKKRNNQHGEYKITDIIVKEDRI